MVKERIYPVGRLDYDTSGILLLTNDGDFAQRLTHPKHEVDKGLCRKSKRDCDKINACTFGKRNKDRRTKKRLQLSSKFYQWILRQITVSWN